MEKQSIRLALVLSVALMSSGTNLFAGNVSRSRASALDATKRDTMFFVNPAMSNTAKSRYGVEVIKDSTDTSVVGSPDNNPQELSFSKEMEAVSAGVLLPFGGGSFGLNYTQANYQMSASNAGNDPIEEQRSDDIYEMNMAIELVPFLDFGFAYRYQRAEYHVYGAFNLQSADQTKYKADFSGYRIGLNYDNKRFAAGIYSEPPMRGKALIDGEQMIVSDPGSAGASILGYWTPRVSAGFKVVRSFYKQEDRAEISTSPIDGRDILLHGLDFDQFYQPLTTVTVSGDYRLNKALTARVHLQRISAIFHFDENSLPGDDREDESIFEHYGLGAGINFMKGPLNFGAGLHMLLENERDEITDRSRKLGHNSFADYSSDRTTIHLSLSYNN